MKLFGVFIVLQCFHFGYSYRILAVIPFSGKSHYLNMQPIVQELADRGHDVTMITTYTERNPNYRQIVVERRMLWEILGKKPDLFSFSSLGFKSMMDFLWDGLYFTTESVFNSSAIQHFIKNDDSHYDLIFAEVLYLEAFYMFSYKYKAPIVGFCPMGYTQYIGETMGSPIILNYMAHEYLTFGSHMSFMQKVINTYSTVYDLVMRQVYSLPRHQALVERHFSHLPQPLPKLVDIERNIPVILLNTHYTADMVRPLVPGIVEVGGVHIKKPKKLPENIQKYLDEAKDGAIYFSLGSNLQCKDMPKEKLDVFLRVFGKLKQRILWKWEDETMSAKPDNVFIGKWMPQNDILAHPNVRLFITHGGLLSTLEATARGVPVIGIPFYSDQHLNIDKVEHKGFGLKLTYADIEDVSLETTIRKILDDPSYRIKAKELAIRFNDRPLSALDTAVYWIEYVIRHKGARFMRSPLLDLPQIEYYVFQLGFIAIFLLLLIVITGFLFIKLLMKCRHIKDDGSSQHMYANGKKNK